MDNYDETPQIAEQEEFPSSYGVGGYGLELIYEGEENEGISFNMDKTIFCKAPR